MSSLWNILCRAMQFQSTDQQTRSFVEKYASLVCPQRTCIVQRRLVGDSRGTVATWWYWGSLTLVQSRTSRRPSSWHCCPAADSPSLPLTLQAAARRPTVCLWTTAHQQTWNTARMYLWSLKVGQGYIICTYMYILRMIFCFTTLSWHSNSARHYKCNSSYI